MSSRGRGRHCTKGGFVLRKQHESRGPKPNMQAPQADVCLGTAQPNIRIGNFPCFTMGGSCAYAGEGAYGAVLLSQTVEGRKCVVKVFKHQSDGEDLKHEVAIMRHMESTGKRCHWLPQLLEVEERKVPFPHIVMEYAGQSLRATLKEGPMPPEVVKAAALQLQAALHAIHGLGVVHLDVKPAYLVVQ